MYIYIYIHTCMCIYIYIPWQEPSSPPPGSRKKSKFPEPLKVAPVPGLPPTARDSRALYEICYMHIYIFIYIYVCFYELRLLSVAILTTRSLLFGLYIRVPDCWKLPYEPGSKLIIRRPYRRSKKSLLEGYYAVVRSFDRSACYDSPSQMGSKNSV